MKTFLQTKKPYYYRFTCENCGCRTHWRSGEITVNAMKASELGKCMAETINRIKKELDECCAGKRMLVGALDEYMSGAFGYFAEMSCPKCKQIQSWAPRMASGFTRKAQQKNADAFNATPVLSKPEIVFGGDLPEPDEPDFAIPCRLEIHGASIGVPHAAPVYLNGIKVGETDHSHIDIAVDTLYKDNLIMVDQWMWTSYVEAKEGKILQLEYKNCMVRKK